MNTAKDLADSLINRAKNLQEFIVFREFDQIIFDGKPCPYSINHSMGMPAEIIVPAISQEEAEQRVNEWLDNQRDAA
jgi:hypothetical protein